MLFIEMYGQANISVEDPDRAFPIMLTESTRQLYFDCLM